ncbi:LysR family transcriptional regulator [Spirillospora sp. CA-108201]
MFALTRLANFVAVAEELHFGRAARRLRMTQPPLSRQIQLLENELKVRLFDRTNRSVRLTPAGRAFLVEARRLLQQADHAAMSVRQVSAGEAGTITLGFTAASAHVALGRVLEAARRALPDVDVVLREMVTRDLVRALAEGGLDLGLVRPPVSDPDLEERPADREPLLAAVPRGHPLAEGEGPVSLADFDGRRFLMYSPVEARYFHEQLVSLFPAGACLARVRAAPQPGAQHPRPGQLRLGARARARGGGPAALRGRGVPARRPVRSGPRGAEPGLAARQRQPGARAAAAPLGTALTAPARSLNLASKYWPSKYRPAPPAPWRNDERLSRVRAVGGA